MMDFRERGRKLLKRITHASPMVVVLVLATSIIAIGVTARFVAAGGFQRERGYPQFIIDRKENKGRAKKGEAVTLQSDQPIFDGEVYRTSLRVQESLDLTIGAVLYVASGLTDKGEAPQQFVERLPKSADALVKEMASKGLLPPGVTASNDNLSSEMSTLAVRYRLDPFGIEIVSLPRVEGDGPALLFRLSDDVQLDQLRYFESMQLKGVTVPGPFTPDSKIINQGWMPREFKGQMVSSTDYRSAREVITKELAARR